MHLLFSLLPALLLISFGFTIPLFMSEKSRAYQSKTEWKNRQAFSTTKKNIAHTVPHTRIHTIICMHFRWSRTTQTLWQCLYGPSGVATDRHLQFTAKLTIVSPSWWVCWRSGGWTEQNCIKSSPPVPELLLISQNPLKAVYNNSFRCYGAVCSNFNFLSSVMIHAC